MATAPHFTKREDVERWLKDKPADWPQAIAVRAALRLFPSLFDVRADSELAGRLVLAGTRAVFMSWAARKYPDIDINAEAVQAYEAALRVSEEAARVEIASASAAVDFVVHIAARASATHTSFGAAFHVDAMLTVPASDDIRWLESVTGTRSGNSELINQPLWLAGEEAPSGSIRLIDSASRFVEHHRFSPWIAWYEALLPADSSAAPFDYFGEALTLRIAKQDDEWWNRPAEEVNAEIARWLEGRNDVPSSPTPTIAAAISALPGPAPAPINFGWQNDLLEALDPETTGNPAGQAQDYLDEARIQALHTQESIGGNAHPSVVRVVARVVDALPDQVAAVRPAVLDVRHLALRSIVTRYDALPIADRELSEEALADLWTLALILQRLCALTIDPAREAVEVMAADLVGKENIVQSALVVILQVATDAPITGARARPVLEALSEELSRPPDEPERRRWLAIAGTALRDWLLEAGRFAFKAAETVAGELKALAKEAYADARPQLVKAASGGIVKIAKAGVVGGVAWVLTNILDELTALARNVPGFDEILRVAREVAKFFKGKDTP